jgi:hypothetical protein
MLTPIRLIGTTDADGAANILSEASYNGVLHSVAWVDGDFADGVDAVLSVTSTDSGVDLTLLTLTDADNDALYIVRPLIAQVNGAAGTDTAQYPVVGRIKLAVTSGGNAKTGGAIVYLEI